MPGQSWFDGSVAGNSKLAASDFGPITRVGRFGIAGIVADGHKRWLTGTSDACNRARQPLACVQVFAADFAKRIVLALRIGGVEGNNASSTCQP